MVSPFAELVRPFIVDLEADGNDHLEIIMVNETIYLTFAFLLNYSKILDSCILL